MYMYMYIIHVLLDQYYSLVVHLSMIVDNIFNNLDNLDLNLSDSSELD